MRCVDLFAGIGGWSVAAHQCGIETVWAAEWDPWKAARYRERFPGVALYGDVEEIDGHELRRRHGPVEFVFGSPPCTDISAANPRGQGVDGSDSRLFFEVCVPVAAGIIRGLLAVDAGLRARHRHDDARCLHPGLVL